MEKKQFNKLDLVQALTQVELHPESRYISCFRTHRSIYRYKRLVFGLNFAPEIFHHEIQKRPIGIETAVNETYDILVMGENIDDSNTQVRKVLQRVL